MTNFNVTTAFSLGQEIKFACIKTIAPGIVDNITVRIEEDKLMQIRYTIRFPSPMKKGTFDYFEQSEDFLLPLQDKPLYSTWER